MKPNAGGLGSNVLGFCTASRVEVGFIWIIQIPTRKSLAAPIKELTKPGPAPIPAGLRSDLAGLLALGRRFYLSRFSNFYQPQVMLGPATILV